MVAYNVLLGGLSLLVGLLFVVQRLCKAYWNQQTAPTTGEIKTESFHEISKADLDKYLVGIVGVVQTFSRTLQDIFQKELTEAKSKLIVNRTKFRNRNLAEQEFISLLIPRDDLQRSLRTKKDRKKTRNKISGPEFGSTDYVPAEAIKSVQTRSSKKPHEKSSTSVYHAKMRAMAKVLSPAPESTSINRSTYKTGNSRPKESFEKSDIRVASQDMIAPTKTQTGISIGKRQSAHMVDSYLFKHLVLVKNSTEEAATLQSKPESRGQNRKEVGKQNSCQTNAAMGNIASQPNLRNQESVVSEHIIKVASANEKSTYSLQETEDPEFDITTHAARDTESKESYDCTVLLPVQSRNLGLSTFTSEENASLANISRRTSLLSKRRGNPSKVRLTHINSDLAPGLKPSSIYMRQLYDTQCRLKTSSANIKRAFSDDVAPAFETMGRKTSLLDLPEKLKACEDTQHINDSNSIFEILPLGKKTYVSSINSSSDKSNEAQEKPQMEGSCSNRGRPKSTEKQNDSTNTKFADKNEEIQAKNLQSDIVSSWDRPMSAKNRVPELAAETRQEIEAFFNHIKETVTKWEKRKKDLTLNADRSKKRNEEQEKPQIEGSCLNQGSPKSPEMKKESTKTKSSDEKQENNAQTYMTDIVSNLGRPRSAQKECGAGSFQNREEFKAQNQLQETISSEAKFQIIEKADSSSKDMTSSKKIEQQENPHFECRSSNQGSPKSPEKQDENKTTKSSDKNLESNAKNPKDDSNLERRRQRRRKLFF